MSELKKINPDDISKDELWSMLDKAYSAMMGVIGVDNLELKTKVGDLPDLLIEKFINKDEWISVDDRLPDHDNYLLITDSRGLIAIGYYWPFNSSMYRDKGRWYNGDYEQFVTHWKPLPQPPK